MKKKQQYLYTLPGMILLMTVLFSCKKDNTVLPSGGASLTIINALVGSSSLVPNFNYNVPLGYYSKSNSSDQIGYGQSLEFGYYSGSVPLSLAQITDTTHTVFKNTISLPKNTIQSLFIIGTVASPDYFQTTDTPPYHAPADSTVGIRFANLSVGSNPVSVDIKGMANGSEVPSLAYKTVTGFKNYAATYKISSYIFEFRDASSGTLLASYTLSGVNNGDGTNTSTNTVRYKNITIALDGLPKGAGSPSQSTIRINNY